MLGMRHLFECNSVPSTMRSCTAGLQWARRMRTRLQNGRYIYNAVIIVASLLNGLRMSPWRASQFLHGKHQLDLYRGPATNACPHIRLPHTRVCFALDINLVRYVAAHAAPL